MNPHRFLILSLSFAFCLFSCTVVAGTPTPGQITALPASANTMSPEKEKQVKAAMRGIAVPFISNQGQVNGQVAFYANTFGGTVFVTQKGEIVYSLPNGSTRPNDREPQTAEETDPLPGQNTNEEEPKKIGGVALRERFTGAGPAQVHGVDSSSCTVNYFIGNDKSKWKRNIPSYESISLGEIYSGIELRLRAYGENVEKLFHVHPGADHQQIRVTMEGADSLGVNREGELEAMTELGPVRFTVPVAYQETDGERDYVEVAYLAKGNGYSFAVGEYDADRELIIDPLLASTFFGSNTAGGEGEDGSRGIAMDSFENVYVTGTTSSSAFPTISGAYDTTLKGSKDVFICRLDADLSSLQASTFLGGSDNDQTLPDYDETRAIAIDSSGQVFVSDMTKSTDFPTTSGAYDTTHNGGYDGYDVFISRLDADLSSLQASTFLGGSDNDQMPAIAIDSFGRIFVSGMTESTDFPTTGGAYDTAHDGSSDVFISRLDADLTSLQASTFLGGSDNEYSPAIAIDSSGRIFVSGETRSTDFPTTGGAYDTAHDGSSDVFISRLDADLTSLQASTFLGGSSSESSSAIAIDSSGRIFVSGYTRSTDFPTTSGAYDATHNGYGFTDVFISRLDADLTSLQASTFLGGSRDDYTRAIAIDSSGRILVSGYTRSTDFPTTGGAYDNTHNGGASTSMSLSPA